ncbi:glycoside hydrolase family 28 protein [Lewinella sp. IMCC34183]|uniref:glycoside hydrolase family 28 protein n=1 Tax=Lewinella sp. IMCC34183 TaxID=2248762 RepID=UPI000E2893DB|nr:glycoside hydrolase family 28 protein [Lewinella sp. IMCC34183]
MPTYVSLFLLLIVAYYPTAVAAQAEPGGVTPDELYTDLPFDMPRVQEPVFAGYEVSITDFGAVGDGQTLNSRAITDAIADVAANGGGTVRIPRGMWLTGPITLRSNIRIHTDAGALVIFSTDKDLYPLVETSFEGLNTFRSTSPINGRDLENIAFTGRGVFDGSGDAWRPVKKDKMPPPRWNKLVKSGGVLRDDGKIWYPSEEYKRADTGANFNVPDLTTREQFEEVKDYLRPVMVSLVNCRNVLLDGPTFQNSPAWNIHPLMCENVIIRNLEVRNPWYSQNGDGLDLESCRNVLIYNNTFDVGDDAICFKSGKDEDGRRRGVPTENVIVSHNTVYHGHGGFVVGSEMSGGVRNVKVAHCTFIGTDVGLRFKSTRGRGGIVENIWIEDIDMVRIPTEAIRFNLFYGGNSPILEDTQRAETEARDETLLPVTEETPSFRNIHMRDIRVTQSETAARFQGLPEMNLQNVTLEDAIFHTRNGITVIDGDGMSFRNIRITQAEGPAMTFYNSKNQQVSEVQFGQDNKTFVRVLGPLSETINLHLTGGRPGADKVVTGQGARADAVVYE